MSDPVGATSVELEEFGTETTVAPPPKLEEMMLDGDDVPEELRGKTAADAIARTKALSEALKLSEDARKQSDLMAQTALRTQPTPPAPPAEEPEMSEEELTQLHEDNPLAAIRVMNAQAIRRAEKNLETRLRPLFSGTSKSVEEQARAKYADEFALFGDQITEIARQVPNAEAVLANPSAWDDIVSLVRGRPGNFDRLVERKSAPKTEETRRAAQNVQSETVGFSGTEARVGSRPMTVANLDPIQREIADKLDMTPEEYVKWSQV